MTSVTFTVPDEIRDLLARDGDVAVAAREAMLVELYRRGTISHGTLARALNLSRDQTDAILKRHGVTEDLPTLAELRAECDDARRRHAC